MMSRRILSILLILCIAPAWCAAQLREPDSDRQTSPETAAALEARQAADRWQATLSRVAAVTVEAEITREVWELSSELTKLHTEPFAQYHYRVTAEMVPNAFMHTIVPFDPETGKEGALVSQLAWDSGLVSERILYAPLSRYRARQYTTERPGGPGDSMHPDACIFGAFLSSWIATERDRQRVSPDSDRLTYLRPSVDPPGYVFLLGEHYRDIDPKTGQSLYTRVDHMVITTSGTLAERWIDVVNTRTGGAPQHFVQREVYQITLYDQVPEDLLPNIRVFTQEIKDEITSASSTDDVPQVDEQ